jgi:hypothetical protein
VDEVRSQPVLAGTPRVVLRLLRLYTAPDLISGS